MGFKVTPESNIYYLNVQVQYQAFLRLITPVPACSRLLLYPNVQVAPNSDGLLGVMPAVRSSDSN